MNENSGLPECVPARMVNEFTCRPRLAYKVHHVGVAYKPLEHAAVVI